MTEIKNGAYVSVGGTVAKIFRTKNGAAFELHVQDERMKYPDRFTVWGCGDEVAEGDRVEVRGWLSTSAETFEKRDGSTGYTVRRGVNAPKINRHEPQQAAGLNQTQPGGTGQGWTDSGAQTGADGFNDVPF